LRQPDFASGDVCATLPIAELGGRKLKEIRIEMEPKAGANYTNGPGRRE
jgi:hypothetical protein